MLAKSVLFFFGIALWYKGLSFYAYYLLPFAWVLDGGIRRFGETIKEPLVVGMLLLCFVLALGILWSDYPKLGFKVWRRYFALSPAAKSRAFAHTAAVVSGLGNAIALPRSCARD